MTTSSNPSFTVSKKPFVISSGTASAWPAGVTKGTVTLVKIRATNQFMATLVAIDKVPQPPVLYYGALSDLPQFLVFVRLLDPPDTDPTTPVMDVTVCSSGPQHDEEPSVPGGPTGMQ